MNGSSGRTAPADGVVLNLAKVGPFQLGRLRVDPPSRELLRDDGARQLLEPRVMQVLVALAQANGAVVGRDTLVQSCWEGRVVGDSAVNRAILLLRRAAAEIGEGAFRIDTVARVGYRLLRDKDGEAEPPAGDDSHVEADRQLPRRQFLGGGLIAAAMACAGYAFWTGRKPPAPLSPETQAMLDQASVLAQQTTVDGTSQAIGILRKVVEIAPGSAEAWGMLANNYAVAAQHWSPKLERQMRLRAEAAMSRAREIEPENGFAFAAEAMLLPRMGAELQLERVLRRGLSHNPGSPILLHHLAWTMLNVGRCREAADMIGPVVEQGRPSPNKFFAQITMLWAAGRLEEAEQALETASSLFTSHYAIWFTRFYLLMYSGRPADALSQSADVENWPSGIDRPNIALIEQVARAMLSRRTDDIDRAIRANNAAAREGTGYCENAIQFASALGGIDEAFGLAQAYYFGRGFEIADVRFAADQRAYSQRKNRRLHILFLPSTGALRADGRFALLARDLGLEEYWRESRTRPDYLE
ncbi:winged helix-turn-helix domain-containing protein [Sphingosinicella sp. BN140058]|uniref:winged helix-turn-helix domain-containing protein n=1 Tax=Sphingosinicella sp. BN140058 TaxID=1892855 RepID=UPI0013E9F67B|nr:winged helix-turn-helix domain-containing protein [Sphingosinicella sp. BN140058]